MLKFGLVDVRYLNALEWLKESEEIWHRDDRDKLLSKLAHVYFLFPKTCLGIYFLASNRNYYLHSDISVIRK